MKTVTGLGAGVLVCSLIAGAAQALPVADDYNRADNTVLGSTPTGGVTYEEFGACCLLLYQPADVAKIESGRLVTTGGNVFSNTDPGVVRLPGLGFDLDMTVEVSVLGDNYGPSTAANGPWFVFRQGLDNANGTAFTKGGVDLVIFPDGKYLVRAVTASGGALEDLVGGAQSIGPAFATADTNGNGILDSDEPFTVGARISGNTFCWFMNGIQVGSNLTIPAAAITGVDQNVATNFLMGRTRLSGGSHEQAIAYDNLTIQAPAGPCPTPPVEVSIDIKPGYDPNSINPGSRGVIPVAILTTETFDASIVDASTVQFGPNGAPPVHSALEDVDGDGDLDLILHFRTQATGIACGDTLAVLTGETTGGQAIEGADAISTVGCH